MPNGARLELIAATPWISELLARFDLDVSRAGDGSVDLVRLNTGDALEKFAGDAAGGEFLFVGEGGEERPVIYAGSEGEGGLVAYGLADLLASVVELPGLHDSLTVSFSGDGGAKLRDWIAQVEADIREDWPEVEDDRARLREALALPGPDGQLERLHAAAADRTYVLMFTGEEPHTPYEPMLGEDS